jgi:hypothetical protein
MGRASFATLLSGPLLSPKRKSGRLPDFRFPRLTFARISVIRKMVKGGKTAATKWQSHPNFWCCWEDTPGFRKVLVMGYPPRHRFP